MATIKWAAPESVQSYLSTGLDSLADSTSDTTGFSASGAEIDNLTDRYQYIDLELVLATQGVARSAGGRVEVWIERKADGTNYEDRANAALVNCLFATFQLDAATTARRLVITNLVLPPLPFKLYVRNDTGQAFASSGSTLKYRRHNEEVA
jgi:hypothetical protein